MVKQYIVKQLLKLIRALEEQSILSCVYFGHQESLINDVDDIMANHDYYVKGNVVSYYCPTCIKKTFFYQGDKSWVINALTTKANYQAVIDCMTNLAEFLINMDNDSGIPAADWYNHLYTFHDRQFRLVSLIITNTQTTQLVYPGRMILKYFQNEIDNNHHMVLGRHFFNEKVLDGILHEIYYVYKQDKPSEIFKEQIMALDPKIKAQGLEKLDYTFNQELMIRIKQVEAHSIFGVRLKFINIYDLLDIGSASNDMLRKYYIEDVKKLMTKKDLTADEQKDKKALLKIEKYLMSNLADESR